MNVTKNICWGAWASDTTRTTAEEIRFERISRSIFKLKECYQRNGLILFNFTVKALSVKVPPGSIIKSPIRSQRCPFSRANNFPPLLFDNILWLFFLLSSKFEGPAFYLGFKWIVFRVLTYQDVNFYQLRRKANDEKKRFRNLLNVELQYVSIMG